MSVVTIRIPTPLRTFTGGADEVTAEGADVGAVLSRLVSEYEGLSRHLFNEDGALREFVNVFLDDRHIGSLGGLESPVDEGAVLSIVPAVAGGGR